MGSYELALMAQEILELRQDLRLSEQIEKGLSEIIILLIDNHKIANKLIADLEKKLKQLTSDKP